MLALVATVLIPIPDTDFDPTEVAVSWQVLTRHGHTVVFSTQSGASAQADDIMLTGRGLDVWSKVPGLSRAIFVGRILRANRDARAAYKLMLASPEYRRPTAWAETDLRVWTACCFPAGIVRGGCAATSRATCCSASSVKPFAGKSWWPPSVTECCSSPNR